MEPGSARKLQLRKKNVSVKSKSPEYDENGKPYKVTLKKKRPADLRPENIGPKTQQSNLEFSRTTKILIGVAVVTLLALGLYFQ